MFSPPNFPPPSPGWFNSPPSSSGGGGGSGDDVGSFIAGIVIVGLIIAAICWVF